MFSKSLALRMRGVLAGLACVAAVAPAVAQTTIDTRIDGLPAGLQLRLDLMNVYCNGPVNTRLASRNLDERTHDSWEQVQLPGGGFQLVRRTVTAYVTQFPRPNLPACGGESVNMYYLTVLGDQEARVANLGSLGTNVPQIRVSMEAKTTEIYSRVNLQAMPLSPVPRNVPLQWIAKYTNRMGSDSTVDAVLDFLVPSSFPFPGALMSHVRLTITGSGVICVRSGSTNTCRTQDQGGTLTAGGVAVDVGNSIHNGPSTSWRFRLLDSFPTGNITVRASANDFDSIEYLVHGTATYLDLLPWKSLSTPVLVNN